MSKRHFSTGSVRNDATGKGRFDLMPPRALREVAVHFEHGATQHGDRNWEKGQPLSVYMSSLLRHACQVLAGETDENHAAAMTWNALAFLETRERIRLGQLPAELDDLPRPTPS